MRLIRHHLTRAVTLAGLGLLLGVGFINPVHAAAKDISVTALPNPPEAPARDVFLISVIHRPPAGLPNHVIIQLRGRVNQTERVSLKKTHTVQYQAIWSLPATGKVTVIVETQNNTVLARQTYPVKPTKPNIVGKIVVGGIFILVSLYFWRRQQKFYRR